MAHHLLTPDNIVLAIGCFYVAIWTSKILCLFARTFMGTECTTQRYGQKSWALVAGIGNEYGKEMVFELAERGFHIIVIDTNYITTKRLINQINCKYRNVQVKDFLIN